MADDGRFTITERGRQVLDTSRGPVPNVRFCREKRTFESQRSSPGLSLFRNTIAQPDFESAERDLGLVGSVHKTADAAPVPV